jgi:hypothetical protein
VGVTTAVVLANGAVPPLRPRPAPPIFSVPLSKIDGVQVIISNRDDKVRLIVTPREIMTTQNPGVLPAAPVQPGVIPQPRSQTQPVLPGQGGE